jgi:hypothetical protein
MSLDRTEITRADPLSPRDQFEAALVERHAELTRVLADLRELQEDYRDRMLADLTALVEENEGLRRALAEKVPAGNSVIDGRFVEVAQELDALKVENQCLNQRLREKEDLLAALQQESAAPREPIDVESYEAELNRFRQQLEADRQKANAELQQLRTRNEELDEATREMEMEFSRERAELARERTRLERLREEVRLELERTQRDTSMRDSLMSVHRLRESISQQK